MKKNRLSAAVVFSAMAALGLTAPSVMGAISVTGGTLHVFVNNGSGFTVAPPDLPFVAPTTSAAADFGPPPFSTLFARESASFVGGQVGISTQTLWSGGTSVASGNLSLTENSSETLWLHVNSGTVGPYYDGLISLDAAGGGNLLSIGFGASNFLPQFDYYIPVTPGNYTLSWSDTGRIVAGQSGGGGFDATMAPAVPEPSCLMLATLGAAMLLLRRRRSMSSART